MSVMAPLTTPSPFARAAWSITFTWAHVLGACTPSYRIRLPPLGSVCCTIRPLHVSTAPGVVLHPVGAVRTILVRAPFTLRASNASEGNRGAHDVWGHGARHALRHRGDLPLWHVGPQPVGRLPATPLSPLIDRLGLQRLAAPRQQMPLPLAAPERLGHILPRLPTFSWGIVALSAVGF